MTRVEQFEEHRRLLFSIAYRLLGSVGEAEDAVQETWLRWDASGVEPASPRAYLSTIVTRVALDVLRSARVRREQYPGPWFPEPLLEDPYEEPERAAELADSLSTAALLLLERLSPLERAVFVLHDVFGFGFDDVADTVGRTEAACRQLASRARRHMAEGRPRFEADRHASAALAARFFDALRLGDVDALREVLAADVQMVADGGGKGVLFGKGRFYGLDAVARVLAAMVELFGAVGGTFRVEEINGGPGAVLTDAAGRVGGAISLEIADGQIQAIRSVTNPDKLGHLGPVLEDGQAYLHEAMRRRREG
ncbi:RNA polymerase, sigma-24 subunit, ECF subfamily [Xylanimonas cellulosilytica DSM 15894]|uniref:RNA polymerase, sigma-24 subunit, ECF subfamily n=1 Tax=Xylanimonas cellulosilytica (strain DSM 15894 / JCM 12276 / CECT 5975 / KCTC 9989 / LMG 20990 / NBRC 107835 / XIL07) TaxID=446471 RepID=D1BZL3_XYLCX|nr:RNA polymerase sigma-70 factor [Xylanimonas cellulosilytica]ACZ30167.1 RNA polymerase, sigma-24 subunit, ECF subfamily [Xylanimonas cellulosilytica DSM 15894]